jgi:hypothetical protein
MRLATIRIAVLVVGLAVLAPLSAVAQDWGLIAKDPEAQNYQLTMDKIRKFMEVQRAYTANEAEAAKIESDFQQLAASKTKLTLTEAAALYDRYAGVRSSLSKAGFTTKEWILTSVAVINAMTNTMQKNNPSALAGATPAQKANVALLETNNEEWQKIQQELIQLGNKAASRTKR